MDRLNEILKRAEEEHNKLNHPYVGTEHLLLAILMKENALTDKLKQYKLTYNRFKRKLISIVGVGEQKANYILYTPMLRNVLNEAERICIETNQNIGEKELFNALINQGEGIAIRIIREMNINIENINFDISSTAYEVDESEIITNREKEISAILQILMRKNKCNPLLIGDAGVGKTAIVEEIQRRLEKNKVPLSLKNYKILKIDLSQLVAGTKYRGDFEEKINKILQEVERDKTIIFIDEIHTLVNAGGADGAISAGDIIKPYLARGKIKCIGATTLNEYHKYFIADQALNRRFQTIMIKETTEVETLDILKSIKNNYENFHKIKISDDLLSALINFGNKYITDKKNPDKSIELLDSCCTNAKYCENSLVNISNLYDVINNRYGIDFSNQFISNIIENHKILLTNKIKDLIDNLSCFSIIVDGSKYQNETDIYNLLGNPHDIQNINNYQLKKVIDNPLGAIAITNYNGNKVLKEFVEKAILNRQILDNHGNIIDFSNYIIILENNLKNKSIGFIEKKDNNLTNNFLELDQNILIKN